RTHQCVKYGTVLDRDHNAAKNILAKGLKLLAEYFNRNSTGGHPETGENIPNVRGEFDHWLADRDISFLSHLVEPKISTYAENPLEP
ncbi:MAG TPA: hypothetical protein V6D48_02825, partial [Oculatellaceae cyanobacterium]